MTLIRRPSPVAELVTLREAMERLFDDRLFRPIWTLGEDRAAVPALDVYTTSDAVIAKIALPGVKSEDLDITIGDDLVTVTGSFTEEGETTTADYVHKELSHGVFSRSFAIPSASRPEDATATFKDGLLTITLPKSEELKPKHVKVDVT
jgi:HSP20 family protein